jgi:hypothetical protein
MEPVAAHAHLGVGGKLHVERAEDAFFEQIAEPLAGNGLDHLLDICAGVVKKNIQRKKFQGRTG